MAIAQNPVYCDILYWL